MNEFSIHNPVAIGIDFGGTSVKLGLVQAGGLTQRAESLSTLDDDTAQSLLAGILNAVDELRAINPDVAAVGAGLPGIVDTRNGLVHHLTNVPGWVNVPLRDLILPATLGSDAGLIGCGALAVDAGSIGAGVERLDQ